MKKKNEKYLFEIPFIIALYTTHLVCFAGRPEVGGTVTVDDEAHPHVARGGQIRAKRREHHLRGISRVDSSLNILLLYVLEAS